MTAHLETGRNGAPLSRSRIWEAEVDYPPGDAAAFSPDFSSIKPTSAWGFSESKKWGR
jgi:hypothetical protein